MQGTSPPLLAPSPFCFECDGCRSQRFTLHWGWPSLCQSVIIALAVYRRHLNIEGAFTASRLEEEYNIEAHGFVEGGHDLDRAYTRVQLAAGSTFLYLLKTPEQSTAMR